MGAPSGSTEMQNPARTRRNASGRSQSANDVQTRSSLVGNAVAGVSAGFVSCLIMHPLDVVTTRMQVQDGRSSYAPKYRNPFTALLVIAKNEGISHLYNGIVPNLVGSMLTWGVYFFGYNYLRGIIRQRQQQRDGDTSKEELGPITNLFCASATGCVSAVLTQPIWLAKTRMELQESAVQYRGMLHCITDAVKTEGAGVLFRWLQRRIIPKTLSAADMKCNPGD